MSAHSANPHNSKEFIALMAICMSITALSIDAMLPALGIIATQLNAAHDNQTQLIVSFMFIGMAIGQLICGPLSDAIGRKKLLLGSLCVYLLGTVCCLLANSIPMMLAGRFIQGLGAAGPYISTMSIVRDRFQGEKMAKLMSLIMMIFIMVPVIAPTIGQTILFFGSWRFIFVLFLVYAAMIMLWAGWRLKETLAVEDQIPFSLSNIFRGVTIVLGNRGTRCYMLCAGCVFGGLIGYLNSSLQIFHEIYGVGERFALYFGALAFTLGVSSLLNSRVVERFGMWRICFAALLVMLINTAVFLSVQFYANLSLPLFLSFMAILFFCMGLVFGNLNALAMEPMGHHAGIAAAVIGFVSSFISITLGTTIGQLYDGTLFPIILGFGLSGTLALVFFLAAGASRRQPEDIPTSAAAQGMEKR